MKRILMSLSVMFILFPSLVFARPPLQENTLTITSLSWSPDGTQIAASFKDRMVKVWALSADGSELIKPPLLTFQPELVDSIRWTSDSKFLVSEGQTAGYVENGTIDADVSKWDAQTGELAEQLFEYHIATKYVFNPYGYYVYPSIGFDSTFTRAAFSNNSNEIAISGDESSLLFTEYGHVKEIVWSPDNTLLAAVYGESDTYHIRAFEVSSGDEVNTIMGADYWVSDVGWSFDNSYLAVSSIWANPFDPYASVRVFSVIKDQDYFANSEDMWLVVDDIESSTNQSRFMPAIAWHPQANTLAVSTRTEINFYAVPSEEPVASISGQDINYLDWSPDGKHLAGSNLEGDIQIWDVPELGA